jgi:cysteine-rich repeat protein
LLALLACTRTETEQGVLVNVTNPSDVAGIVWLRVSVSNKGPGKTLLFATSPQGSAIKFPTALSITVPASRTGPVDIAVDGLDGSLAAVANGASSAVLLPGAFVGTAVELRPGASLCGNGLLDPGETCDDGRRFSGDGCSYLCQSESGADASSSVDVGVGVDSRSSDDAASPVDDRRGETADADVSTGDARLPAIDTGAADVVTDMSSEAGGAGGTGGLGGSSTGTRPADAGATGGVTGTGGLGGVATGGAGGLGGMAGTAGALGVGGTAGSGGVTASGGSIGTGGSMGGIVGTGGSMASGGVVGTGGVLGTGGNMGSGGTAGVDGGSGRFVVSGDGLTVTDTSTGLLWESDGSGPRAGCAIDAGIVGSTCTWSDAQSYCAGLIVRGLTGWRVPTVNELLPLVDGTVPSPPKINQTAFPDTPADWFWTSSPIVGDGGGISYAWRVDFLTGTTGTDYLASKHWVRCVR